MPWFWKFSSVRSAGMFLNSKMSFKISLETLLNSKPPPTAMSNVNELWRELALKSEVWGARKKEKFKCFWQQPKSTKDQPQTTCLPHFPLFCNIKTPEFHFAPNKLVLWNFPSCEHESYYLFFSIVYPHSIIHPMPLLLFISAKSSCCSVNISAPIKKLFSSFSSTSPPFFFCSTCQNRDLSWKSNWG